VPERIVGVKRNHVEHDPHSMSFIRWLPATAKHCGDARVVDSLTPCATTILGGQTERFGADNELADKSTCHRRRNADSNRSPGVRPASGRRDRADKTFEEASLTRPAFVGGAPGCKRELSRLHLPMVRSLDMVIGC